jgi:hypothetical protein
MVGVVWVFVFKPAIPFSVNFNATPGLELRMNTLSRFCLDGQYHVIGKRPSFANQLLVISSFGISERKN